MRKLLLPMVLALSGCGNDASAPKSVFHVETDNVIVNQLFPSIRAKLPGLDKYSAQLKDVQLNPPQEDFLEIQFKVPNEANVPPGYVANGHTCFIRINSEHTAIQLPKINCLELMFDQKVETKDASWLWYTI